jgi:hypothetical protein
VPKRGRGRRICQKSESDHHSRFVRLDLARVGLDGPQSALEQGHRHVPKPRVEMERELGVVLQDDPGGLAGLVQVQYSIAWE